MEERLRPSMCGKVRVPEEMPGQADGEGTYRVPVGTPACWRWQNAMSAKDNNRCAVELAQAHETGKSGCSVLWEPRRSWVSPRCQTLGYRSLITLLDFGFVLI